MFAFNFNCDELPECSNAVAAALLLQREQVPAVFWEVGIHTGYRKPRSSLKECLRSAFSLNNETMNFWTHFLPCWYFVWHLRAHCADADFVGYSYHWPYLVYLTTVCCYPAVSCFAHLFSVMSERMRHVCFFLDYMALSWYSFGVAVVYHAYCFDEMFFNTWYSGSFLYLCAAASLFCTIAACQSRFIQHVGCKKIFRILAFAVPYWTISFPLIGRILRCSVAGCVHAGIALHVRQFIWAITMIVIYGFHIPECFAPGLFDIVGHSHQIFHTMGIMASYDQMWACFIDMQERKPVFQAEHFMPAGRWDVKLAGLILLLNILIVALFTMRLYCGRRVSKTSNFISSSDPNVLSVLSTAKHLNDERIYSEHSKPECFEAR